MEAVTSAAAPAAGRFDEHSYLESGFPVRAFMAEPAYLDVLNISSIGSSIPAVGGPPQPRPNHQHTNSSSSSGELAQLQKQMILEMTGGTSCNQEQQQHLVQTGMACVVAGTGNLDHFQASQHQQDRGSSHDGSVVQLVGAPAGAADGENPVQPQHIEEDTLASATAAAAATAASADAPASAAEDVTDKCNTDGLADMTAAAAAADVHAPAVQPNATGACHTAVQGHTLTINPAAATAAAAAAAATGHPAGLKVDITSPGMAVTTPGFRSLQGLVSPGTEELQGCCAALMMLRDLQHPDSAAAAEIKELVPKAYAPGSRGGFRVGAAAVTAAAAARASGYLGQSSSNAGTNGAAAAAAGSGRLPGLAAAAGVKAGGIQGTAADQEALQDDQVAEQEQQLQLALRRGKRQRKPQRWGEQLLMLDQLVDDVVAESHSSGGFRDWEQRHVTWQQPLPQEQAGVLDLPALAAAEGPEDDAGDASYDAAADGDAEMLDYEQEMEIDEEGGSHHFRRSSSHRGAKKVTGGDSSASGDYHPAAGGGSTAKSGRRRKRGSSGSGGARLPKARKIRKGAKPLYDNDGAVNDSTAREHSTVSSYLGVSKKRTGKWQAAVRFGHDGAYAFWCCYNCPKTAARARDAAALALRGPGSARLNFPEDSYSDDELLAAAAQILAKHPHLHSHLGHPLVAGMSLSQVLAAGGLAAAAAAAAVEEDEVVAAAAAAVAAAETGELVNAGRIEAAAEGVDDGETGAISAEAAAELAAAVAAAAMAMAAEETAAAVAEAAAITSEAAGTGAAKQQLQPRRTRRRSAPKKSKDLTELAATEAEVEAAMQPPAEIVEAAAAAPVAPAPLVPTADPPVMISTRDTAALFSRVFDLAALVVFGAEAATEIPATAFSNEELAAAAAAMSCRMPLALQQQQLQQQLDACQQQQQQQQGLTMGTKEEEQQQTTDSEEKAVCIVTTPSVVKGGAADGSSTAAKQQKGSQRAAAAADQDAPPMAMGSSEQEWQQQQQLDCSKQQHSSVDEAVAAAAKPAAARALTGHQQYTGCGNLELQQPQLRTAATAGC